MSASNPALTTETTTALTANVNDFGRLAEIYKFSPNLVLAYNRQPDLLAKRAAARDSAEIATAMGLSGTILAGFNTPAAFHHIPLPGEMHTGPLALGLTLLCAFVAASGATWLSHVGKQIKADSKVADQAAKEAEEAAPAPAKTLALAA